MSLYICRIQTPKDKFAIYQKNFDNKFYFSTLYITPAKINSKNS